MTHATLLTLLIALAMRVPESTAHAEQSEQPSSLFVRLSPTAEELQRERTAALERRLAELLSSWPGVTHAEVQLTLPLAAEQPLDHPLPSPRAAVVLTRSTDEPRAEVVLKLLQSALPTLEPHDLTVLDNTAMGAHRSRATAGAPFIARAPQGGLRGAKADPAHTAAALGTRAEPRISTANARAHANGASISELRVGLATSLAVNALLAAIVLWRLRRNRPAVQKVDPQARLSSPP